jgi:prolyl oligopeptidase PreP (S9A serine peptidase family)
VFARTDKERRRNSAKVVRRRTLLENWVEPKLRRASRKLASQSALEYQRGGAGRLVAIAIADYREEVGEILSDLYAKSAKSMAKLLSDSGKSFFDDFETKDIDTTLERVLQLFDKQALEQAKTIAESEKEDVLRVMRPLVQEGAGEAEIARAIKKHVEGGSAWKARRIARTETLISTSKAQSEIINEMDDML